MLQAKAFTRSSSSSTPPKIIEIPTSQLFPYGWRYVKKRLADGTDTYDQIPLTAEDLLNPQEGDQVPQRDKHFQLILDLAGCLKTYYANDPTVGVFGDLIMDWGIPGLSGPAPDLAIVPNLRDKDRDRGTFKVAQEGTRPCFILEVMSPGHPGDDDKKVKIYERAGVAEYFLIKPPSSTTTGQYELCGYRLENGVYRPLLEGLWGTVLVSETVPFQFEVTDQGQRVRIKDRHTGRWLLTQTEEAETRAELEQRLRQLENLLKSRT